MNHATTETGGRVSRRLSGAVAFLAALGLLAGGAFGESADEVFARAKRLGELKKYGDAAEVMLDFQTQFPDDERVAEAQYLSARYQHLRNYLNTALKEYQYCVEDFSDTVYAAQAYAHMADIFVHMELPQKAIDALEKQAEDFHDSREAFHGLRKLGDIYLGQKDEDSAVKTFQRLIQYDAAELLKHPDGRERNLVNADVRRGVFFLAERAIKQKDYEAAKQAYMRLPDLWEKVRLLVDLLYQQEKFDEIHELIRDMEEENFWQAQALLLEFYAKRKSMPGLKHMMRTLTAEREPSDALTRLLRRFPDTARDMAGDDAKREALTEIAARYRPLRREFEYAICGMDWASSPDTCERFILTYEKGGDVEQCKTWRGIFFELKKEREKAQQEYWRLADKPTAHFKVAETYHGHWARQAGNVDLRAALAEYKKIRQQFYNTAVTCEAYWRMAHLHAQLGEKDAAIATLAEMETRFTGQPRWQVRSRYQIAEWQRAWVRYEDAVDSYRLVDKRYPQTGEQQQSVYNIGLCWEQLGEREKAIKAFLECIRRFDQTPIQSAAHTRLEVEYKIPDLQIEDMKNNPD